MKDFTEDVTHLDFSKVFDIDPSCKMLLEKLIQTVLDRSINNSVD